MNQNSSCPGQFKTTSSSLDPVNVSVVHSERDCPLCGGSDTTLIYESPDYLLSENRQFHFDHKLGICSECGFLFCTNLYSSEDLEAFYRAQPQQYRLSKSFSLEKRLAQLSSIQANIHSLLEVGANTKTEFHHELDKQGIRVNIYELQDDCEERLHDLGSIALHSQDVICLYHTLEHIQDPVGFLHQLRNLNSPQGSIIVEVPDVECYSEYPGEFSIPLHLTHFTAETLKRLFDICGYKLICYDKSMASHPRGIYARFEKCHDDEVKTRYVPTPSIRNRNSLLAYKCYSDAKNAQNRYNQLLNRLKHLYLALPHQSHLVVYGVNNTTSKLLDFLTNNLIILPSNIILVDDDTRKSTLMLHRGTRILTLSQVTNYLDVGNMFIVVTQTNAQSMISKLVDLSRRRLDQSHISLVNFK